MSVNTSTTPGKLMANRKSSASPLASRYAVPSAKNIFKNDRFIPARSNMNFELAEYALSKENKIDGSQSPVTAYQQMLKDNFLPASGSARILSFKEKAPEQPKGYQNAMASLYDCNFVESRPSARAARALPRSAERRLDCPGMLDDYYLNLLDWSSSNVIAIALGNSVHLFNAETGKPSQLCSLPEEDNVTSLSWSADGKHLAVGTSASKVQLWDCTKMRQIRSLSGHSARVSSLSWNKSVLSSGSRDTSIINHDVRIKAHVQSRLTSHTMEVCQLKWSPSGGQLASGSQDSMLYIWQNGATQPAHCLSSHRAAVKALAWCPFQSNLLASGGGSADRCIKTWNTHTGAELNSVDTKSQVCSLVWNARERELLSSHGYSRNELALWQYPTMTKVGQMLGHTGRALHLATSPDGSRVCSAGADEQLCVWKCFSAAPKAKKYASEHSESVLRTASIR